MLRILRHLGTQATRETHHWIYVPRTIMVTSTKFIRFLHIRNVFFSPHRLLRLSQISQFCILYFYLCLCVAWNASAHSRTASIDLRHSRNSSADLNKIIRNDVGLVFNPHQQSSFCDPLRVQIIKAHHNWISAAYPHFVTCYRLKDSSGWQLVFTSPYIEATIERLAIKVNFANANEKTQSKMVAISYGSQIRLWRVSDDGSKTDVGIFNLNVRVEYLFFIGNQLVALSSSGKIGVWHAMTQHWQIQDLCPILSFDTAGSFLLLGCINGCIYYIGMCVK